jgi:2-dehydro-3-deoxyphosphogluconate aldolase / (4S)-4-hydroxy-2-oxoglutarate aldolase
MGSAAKLRWQRGSAVKGFLTLDQLVNSLRRHRLVAVIRTTSTLEAAKAIERCLDGGVRILEITTSVPEWPHLTAELCSDKSWSDIVVGVGTVTSGEHARLATISGAQFLVSPYGVPEVREAAQPTQLIEGGFTPTEVAEITRRGVAKLFPAASGGTTHLKALLDVLPTAQIVVTGGITPRDTQDFIDAGALAVGLGSAFVSLPSEVIAQCVSQIMPPAPNSSRSRSHPRFESARDGASGR